MDKEKHDGFIKEGNQFLKFHEYQKAIKSYEKALKIYSKVRNPVHVDHAIRLMPTTLSG